MKTTLVCVSLLLVAAPSLAQVDVVVKYRANYPTPMSADQKVDLLRHVAVDVHGGLLVKPDGTNCGGYACDVICFSDAVLFDVLFDQDTAASPRWNPTSNPRNYHCELAGAATPPPVMTPPPVPVPVLDLSGVLAAIADVRATQERIFAYENTQRDQQTTTLKAEIDSPAWYSRLFGNQYVQLALVGLGTYLTTHQVMK